MQFFVFITLTLNINLHNLQHAVGYGYLAAVLLACIDRSPRAVDLLQVGGGRDCGRPDAVGDPAWWQGLGGGAPRLPTPTPLASAV